MHVVSMSDTQTDTSMIQPIVPQTLCLFPYLTPLTSFVRSLLAITYPHLEARFGLQSALFFPTVGLGWRPECCL